MRATSGLNPETGEAGGDGGVDEDRSTVALDDLRRVCQELEATRRRVAELARRRNELVRELRAAGVGGTDVAEATGLSQGRVSQLTDGPQDRSPLTRIRRRGPS